MEPKICLRHLFYYYLRDDVSHTFYRPLSSECVKSENCYYCKKEKNASWISTPIKNIEDIK